MWIFTKIIVFVSIILETNCKYYKGETEVRKFVPAAVHYRNRTKLNEESDRVIRWKIMNDEANLTATEETGDTSTTSTSTTTTTTTTVKKVTVRTWIPADTTTTVPPPTNIHHHSTTYPNKNDSSDENVCPHFKIGEDAKFDLTQMVDVWQTVYYQLPDELQCFKIYIRHISDDDRKIYEKKYSTLGGSINWNECMLEVESAPKINRRHFLQGINDDLGVMENIIIVKDKETNTPSVQDESADQWLVVDRLLLMRDCDSAGFVVFAKIPFIPRQSDIEDALKIFGEEYGNGKHVCVDEELIKSPEAEDEQYL